eukprot:2691020-Ditylum_brightwellii.AAC.1
MDAQLQPSLDWIKGKILATNNSLVTFQTQMLQAMNHVKEENTREIKEVREETTQRDITNSQTMTKIYELLEGMRGVQPQVSPSSAHQKQGQSGTQKL